jgi:hypothetical protein
MNCGYGGTECLLLCFSDRLGGVQTSIPRVPARGRADCPVGRDVMWGIKYERCRKKVETEKKETDQASK